MKRFSHKTQFKFPTQKFPFDNVYKKPKEKKTQESRKNVSGSLESPILVENEGPVCQDVWQSPSPAKWPRVENSSLESLRASSKEEFTSEISSLLNEPHKELLKMLKPKTGECVNEEDETTLENETRFYTPTKSVRMKSTQSNDPCTSRNIVVHKELGQDKVDESFSRLQFERAEYK